MDLTEHATRNRAQWNEWAAEYVPSAERNWQPGAPVTWGMWDVPETQVQLFGAGGIERFAGRDVIELGCGAGYVSSWLARAGATVTGIDISDGQLATARRLQAEHGVSGATFVQASAEAVPFEDASFDLAISEYGACLWCDPERWVPEAARVLRPGGELIFLTTGLLAALCIDAAGEATSRELQRSLFELGRTEYPDDDGVEWQLSHGEWIRVLGTSGLQVERLVELQAPAGATTRYTWANGDWAHRWPSEEAWVARKVG